MICPPQLASPWPGQARTICLAGDGSLQMNVQELQTVVGYNLPVKIFVLEQRRLPFHSANADGFFQGPQNRGKPGQRRHLSRNAESRRSLWNPLIHDRKVDDLADRSARTRRRPAQHCSMSNSIRAQEFEPRLRSRILPDGKILTPNLEDMYPFLSPEELARTCWWRSKMKAERSSTPCVHLRSGRNAAGFPSRNRVLGECGVRSVCGLPETLLTCAA